MFLALSRDAGRPSIVRVSVVGPSDADRHTGHASKLQRPSSADGPRSLKARRWAGVGPLTSLSPLGAHRESTDRSWNQTVRTPIIEFLLCFTIQNIA